MAYCLTCRRFATALRRGNCYRCYRAYIRLGDDWAELARRGLATVDGRQRAVAALQRITGRGVIG